MTKYEIKYFHRNGSVYTKLENMVHKEELKDELNGRLYGSTNIIELNIEGIETLIPLSCIDYITIREIDD